MAVIPGTKFTELAPPSQTTQTTLSPSLASTQSEQMVAERIGKFGGAIEAYALNAAKQEMVLEFSEKKRQIDERGWAARNTVTGDEEADRKLWEQFQTDAQLIAASSKYEDVNNDLTIHLNSVSPNWQQGIRTASITKQRANNKDKYEIEGMSLLENGRVDEYTKMTNDMWELGVITEAERDGNIKSASANSGLLVAQRLISLDQSEAALKQLNSLSTQNMTNKQIQQRNILISTAEKQKDDVSHTLTNDVLGKIQNGMPLNQVAELIQQTVGIDNIQKDKLLKLAIGSDDIRKKVKQDPFFITQDPEKLVDTWNKIKNGQITEFNELFDAFRSGPDGSAAFSLNYAQWLDNELDSMKGKKKSSPIVTEYRDKLWKHFTRNGKLPTENIPIFREKSAKLDDLLKQYINDPTRMATEYDKLITGVKEDKAKQILMRPIGNSAWWYPMPSIPTAPQPNILRTATNPKTGERMGWDGTKWIKL